MSKPKPVQTYTQAVAWVREHVTRTDMASYESPQAALLWFYANHLSDQYADMNRREWAETIQAGMPKLTARGMARDMREALEDEPGMDWREELENFFNSGDDE